jgi:hypothetical protein
MYNLAKFRKIEIEFRQNFIDRLISNIKFGSDKGFRPGNLWHGAVLPSIWLKSTLNSSPGTIPAEGLLKGILQRELTDQKCINRKFFHLH